MAPQPAKPAQKKRTTRAVLRREWDKNIRRNDLIIEIVVGVIADAALLLGSPSWADTFVAKQLTGVLTVGTAVTGVLLGLTLAVAPIMADHVRAITKDPTKNPTGAPATATVSAVGFEVQPAGSGDGDDKVQLDVKHVEVLVRIFLSSASYLGLATVLGLVGLFPTGIVALKIILALWVVVTTVAIGSVARSLSLFRLVVLRIVGVIG